MNNQMGIIQGTSIIIFIIVCFPWVDTTKNEKKSESEWESILILASRWRVDTALIRDLSCSTCLLVWLLLIIVPDFLSCIRTVVVLMIMDRPLGGFLFFLLNPPVLASARRLLLDPLWTLNKKMRCVS